MFEVDNNGTYPTQIYNNGPIAVVAVHYSKRLLQVLKGNDLFHRVSSIHYLIPETRGLKATPLKEIRAGWARVQREIRIFAPHAQRILFFTDTKSLRVVVPGCPGEINDVHGTLFTIGDHIVVPTFMVDDIELEHVQPWMERDFLRCIKLTKPAEPLNYIAHFPHTKLDTVVIDLETTGLDPETDTITVLGLQWGDNERALITTNIDRCITALCMKLLSGEIHEVWIHNAQFDTAFMGGAFRNAVYGKLHDTMLIAKSRGEIVATLKHLGNLHTASPGNYAWYVPGSSHQFTDAAYVCEDLDVTWRLRKLWHKDTAKPINQLMERAVLMAVDQTTVGTKIDEPYLEQIVADTRAFLAEAEVALTEKYGCHPNQTEQLVHRLTEMGYVFSKQTASGKDSLTADVLEENGLDDILEYRRAMKLDSAFVGKLKALMRPGSIMPHRQTMLGAETGRTTMTSFNWQQMPKKGPGKKLVVSRYPGGLIAQVDLSQAELRIAAYLSNDHAFAAVLARGDAHRENASMAFNVPISEVTEDQRFQAKAVVFRTIYGGRPITEGQKRVYEYMEKAFPDLFRWMKMMQQKSIREKYITDTYGKTRNLKAVFDYRGKWAVGRAGINSPVQGVASHAAIELTLYTWERLSIEHMQSLCLFGVHDSQIGDVHPDEESTYIAIVQNSFRNLLNTTIGKYELARILPLTGELQLGRNWADVKNGEKIICSSLE